VLIHVYLRQIDNHFLIVDSRQVCNWFLFASSKFLIHITFSSLIEPLKATKFPYLNLEFCFVINLQWNSPIKVVKKVKNQVHSLTFIIRLKATITREDFKVLAIIELDFIIDFTFNSTSEEVNFKGVYLGQRFTELIIREVIAINRMLQVQVDY